MERRPDPVVGASCPAPSWDEMTRIGIIGLGAVGARLARQLVSTDVDEVVIRDDSLSRAELVGNSPQSIAKFYSHLESKRDVMKEAARRAIG